MAVADIEAAHAASPASNRDGKGISDDHGT